MTQVYGLDARSPVQDARFDLVMSTVRLARLALGAQAASIFLAAPSGKLRIEAISGEGEDKLLGWEIPAYTGIAGWVFQTGETVLVKDLASDQRFDREAAESTGFVPDVLVASALSVASEEVGVLEVLDPDLDRHPDQECLAIVGELARQTCAAIVMAEMAHPPGAATVDVTVLQSVIGDLAASPDPAARAFVSSLADLAVSIARRRG